MKYFLIAALITLPAPSFAQMSSRSYVPFGKKVVLPASSPTASAAPGANGTPPTTPTSNSGIPFTVDSLATFGLYGIGNTNTETFNSINSSGKLSGYIRPFKGKITKARIPFFIDVNFGFNVNASNTDSLLANTLLFPDVGQNSFSGSAVFNFALGKSPDYYLISPFFEFAQKSVRGRKADSTRNFYTLNNSYGINFQYLYVKGKDNISFTISPYLASVNVPDPGTKDYKYLFTGNDNSPLKTTLNSWGIKVTFQYNYFQIFSDFRNVKGTEADLPVIGLRGFHPNVGIIFNAEIFEN